MRGRRVSSRRGGRGPRLRPRRPSSRRSRRSTRSSACATASCATRRASGGCRRRSTSPCRPPATSARCRRKGGGLAILKWVTSFPGNPARGLPVVMGMICVSSAETGEPLALVDVRAVTALRTGAVAAVAAQELAREDARSVGIVGCGLHGAWAARCLAAAEFGPGVCFDVDPRGGRRAGRRAGLGGGRARGRARLRRRHLRDARPRAGRARERPAARACTSTCSAPTGPARPRPSSTRSTAAASSATSGRRRATAAS